MALFPFFMDISGKYGLIIGGGKHALEKIERLRPYAPKLFVVAESFLPEIEAFAVRKPDGEEIKDGGALHMCVQLVRRNFIETDLDGKPMFVIAATESREKNRNIAALCRTQNILVNVVDDPAFCDFVFPCLIAKGKLSVGICTDGASPSVGIQLKKKVEAVIPDRVEEILDWLQEKRPIIKKEIPDGKKRFAFYHRLSERCMRENRALSETEFLEMFENGDCEKML